jgi:hypothetical protein
VEEAEEKELARRKRGWHAELLANPEGTRAKKRERVRA